MATLAPARAFHPKPDVASERGQTLKTRCSFPGRFRGRTPGERRSYARAYGHHGHHPARCSAGHRPAYAIARCPGGRSKDGPGGRQGALEKNLHGLLSPESYPRRKESHACANKHPDRSQVYPVRRRTATLFESGGTRRCFEPEEVRFARGGVRFARLRPPTRAASTIAVVTMARSSSEITYGGIA